MKNANEFWKVGSYSCRPISPDRCTYCGELPGAIHKPDCVIRQRTVVVKATIEYVISVPEDWDEDNIEFHRNESSWCASNGLEEIDKLAEHLDAKKLCPCDIVAYEYVREATEADHEMTHIKMEEMQS